MNRIELNKGSYPYLKQLLYGLSGSGKTRFAYSAALDDRMFPAIALNAQGNPVSVSDYARLPDMFNIEAISDLNAVYSFLKAKCPADHIFAKRSGIDVEAQGPYKCIILDGITEIQRIASDGYRNLDGKDMVTAIPPLGRPGFYSLLEQTTRIVRLFYSLNIHVIITALEHDATIEGSELTNSQPLLLGQSSREVPSYAVSTARMMQSGSISKTHKKLMTANGAKFPPSPRPTAIFGQITRQESKDGTGALPMAMVDPTMTEVLDLIEAKNAIR